MNTGELQPIGKRLPKIGRVYIKIGQPIDFTKYAGLAGERVVERAVTDEIMYALMELSGQAYIDEYAAKVKELAEKASASAAEAAAVKAALDRQATANQDTPEE
jgi:1-acyl-sn-glycerol-3-phosphate acyltransferase